MNPNDERFYGLGSSSGSKNQLCVLAWPTETTNPYTSLLYSNMRPAVRVADFSAGKLFGKYSVWHVHWPESLLNIRNSVHAAAKIKAFFAALDYLKLRGSKIIWTVHNLRAHEKLHPSLEAWFWRKFIPRVDGAISLSCAALSKAKDQFPRIGDIPTAVIRHGHYRSEYSEAKSDFRKRLGISSESKVLLFFGAIREYKNVDLLVRQFRATAASDVTLAVVGCPNSASLSDRIAKEASSDPRIRLLFEFVKAEEVPSYFATANVVVLPYREILNSGAALLALSLNRPILVPRTGSMGELADDFGDSWVRTYAGEISPAILENALDWAEQQRPRVSPMPEPYDWQHIARQTTHFYERVIFGETATSSVADPLLTRSVGSS
jgi:beta-1,4-mannosyltransferase